MKTDLVVNPLAVIEVEENGGVISLGPVPGRGLRSLRVTADDETHLHELFTDLSSIGLGSLNIENDLTPREIGLLEECGVLVSPDGVPERPLFSCQLDDVEAEIDLPNRLIVNPTLEFQPFDLTNFRSWIQIRYLSPHQATVWVTDEFTGIRWGYWLTPDQAATAATLTAGTEPPDSLDRSLAAKLFTAGILIASNNIDCRDEHKLADKFDREGYVVIDDIIPPAQLRALQTYYRNYCAQGFMRFGDDQVPLRFAQNDEPVARHLHGGLTALMSRLAGTPVEATYTYSASYVEGAELKPHMDRDECVYSFSLQLDYAPKSDDGVSPWPLYISANHRSQADPGKDRAIHLSNGSCLVYKGRELVHYRLPLPQGHRSTSLFFHYVPATLRS